MRIAMLAAAALASAGLAFAAYAQNVDAQRESLMKEMAGAARTLTQMARGQAPYEAAAAQAAFTKLRDNAKNIPSVFPESSKTKEGDDKAEASPKIWSDWARFTSIANKLEQDAAAGIPEAAKGKDAIGPALQKAAANCQSCHEAFRIERKS